MGQPAMAVGGGAFGGGPDDVGNDGLTTVQRNVLAVFEEPAHLAASEGITVEQVMRITSIS